MCKQGPRTAKDKVPAQEKLQPGLGSFLQGCYKELNIHWFEAAFGQGTDSLDSYKAAPAKGAAEAAQEERSLSATWFEKNPSFLLLLRLLKKGIASGGLCMEELSQCQRSNLYLGFSLLIPIFNRMVGLN